MRPGDATVLARRLRGQGLAILVGLAAGCATGSAARSSASDVLTRAEIDESTAENAYDAVRQLRPQYLRGRALVSVEYPSASVPIVYVDGLFRGDLSSLRAILVHDIAEIQFIDASDATTRWGTGHPAGVIHVVTN